MTTHDRGGIWTQSSNSKKRHFFHRNFHNASLSLCREFSHKQPKQYDGHAVKCPQCERLLDEGTVTKLPVRK